jgi:hypothetical protein
MLQNGAPPTWETLGPLLRDLERAAGRQDGPGVRAWLKRLVPEYGGVQRGDVAIAIAPAVGAPRIAVSGGG